MRQSYSTVYHALTDIYGDFYLLWSRDENMVKALQGVEISNEDINTISRTIDNAVFRDALVDSVYLVINYRIEKPKELLIETGHRKNQLKKTSLIKMSMKLKFMP